jgi:hypothetical protein
MEMSVELIVFLGIGMILMGLFTTFLYQWDMKRDVANLKDMYSDDKTPVFKVDRIGFMNAAVQYWDYCNHSYANQTKTYYVYGSKEDSTGIINKSVLFGYYRELSFCQSIQSANQSCGRREDVNMSYIVLPSLVTLACRNQTLHIYPPNETR